MTKDQDAEGGGVPIAAVDLGSNSFHLLVARWTGNALQVVDRRKEPVRLAAGLTEDRRLSEEARARALVALERFGERIGGLDGENVRAVGTNTFRAARDLDSFLQHASKALGHRIEVISGAEEARLVYLGVAHERQPTAGNQLVVDIGGGSTECVIGAGFEARSCRSLRMGCVTFTRGFFPGGKINRDRLRAATFAAANELASVELDFQERGWERVTGSSGTIRAVEKMLRDEGWSDHGISSKGLGKLREALLDAGSIDDIDVSGLSDRRREVIPGGVAILSAAFERLGIERMMVSDGALREGVAYDLIGRFEGADLRETTIAAMQERYAVDRAQAERVHRRIDSFLDAVAGSWEMEGPRFRRFARWAAALHEIGLSLSHSGYHKHGAYLIEHSDMAGFSRADQKLLAGLVLCHRRKFRHEALEDIGGLSAIAARRLAALLRLAVRFERGRGTVEPPEPKLTVDDDCVVVQLPAGSAEDHPLTLDDLLAEKSRLERADIELVVEIGD